jgi:hypothetical protein
VVSEDFFDGDCPLLVPTVAALSGRLDDPGSCSSIIAPSALAPPVMLRLNKDRLREYPLLRVPGDIGEAEGGDVGDMALLGNECTFDSSSLLSSFRRVPTDRAGLGGCFGPADEEVRFVDQLDDAGPASDLDLCGG